MLDMNAPYDVDTCIRFAREAAQYDIYWLEEPLHWYLQPPDYVTLGEGDPYPAGTRRARNGTASRCGTS